MKPSLRTATGVNQQPAPWQVAPPPIHILIADDHPPLREGLSALLERQADLKVIAMAADFGRPVRLLRSIVQTLVLPVFDAWNQFFLSSSIASQFVSDNGSGSTASRFQQFDEG